jgi:hypothetical protein
MLIDGHTWLQLSSTSSLLSTEGHGSMWIINYSKMAMDVPDVEDDGR